MKKNYAKNKNLLLFWNKNMKHNINNRIIASLVFLLRWRLFKTRFFSFGLFIFVCLFYFVFVLAVYHSKKNYFYFFWLIISIEMILKLTYIYHLYSRKRIKNFKIYYWCFWKVKFIFYDYSSFMCCFF